MEKDGDPLQQLPIEVILENVFSNLDLQDICTIRCVNKVWNYQVTVFFARLRKLDLTEVKDIINELGFNSIVRHLSSLKEINLDGCWRTASKSNLFTLFKNNPSLKCFSSKRCKFVDDEILTAMSKNCIKLEVVNISCCYQITSSGVIELFKNCKNLSIFTVAGNYGFTDEAMKFIGSNCESITEIDFGSCFYVTDIGIEALLNGPCTQLSYIRIKGCTKISEDMTKRLVRRGIVVNNCF